MAYQGVDGLGERIRACAAGDAGALKALYDSHAGFLLGVIVPIVGARRAAETVLGEIYLALWRHASGFDPRTTTARAWIIGLARHVAIRRRPAPPDPAARPSVLPEGGPESEEVRAKLDALPDPARTALVSAYVEGLPLAGIAARLSIDEARAKAYLAQALLALDDGADPGRVEPAAAYVLGLSGKAERERFEAGSEADPALARRAGFWEDKLSLLHDGRSTIRPSTDPWNRVARRLGEAQKAGMRVEQRTTTVRRRRRSPLAALRPSLWLWCVLAIGAVVWALSQGVGQSDEQKPLFFAPHPIRPGSSS